MSAIPQSRQAILTTLYRDTGLWGVGLLYDKAVDNTVHSSFVFDDSYVWVPRLNLFSLTLAESKRTK